jgi:protein-disulfide isomerase
LKIIEFSDYQCPFCRQIDPNLEALVKKMPGKVAIVRFDLPLKQIHPYAYKAAIASRCAAVQGIYEPYEKELFQENLSSADWLGFARRANVPDLSQFSACVSGDETAPLVEADIKTANSLGITSTPILIINGQTFPGAQSEQALEQMVSDNE